MFQFALKLPYLLALLKQLIQTNVKKSIQMLVLLYLLLYFRFRLLRIALPYFMGIHSFAPHYKYSTTFENNKIWHQLSSF